MEGTQGLQGFKIALLIDFDNVILGVEDPGFDVELVVNALRSRGSVVMGRAYGDWYRHNRHRRKLMEQGIELVETPVFGPVIKNSADIRIVLDGFEIAMLQHHIDAFCLVSGDSDFLPLIKKLQYLGKHVIVISGNKFTSDLVRRNCNEFVSYENLLAESLGATEDVSTLEGSFALLARGIATLHERGMEVRSSTVKQMMLQLNPAFSERNFGCAQFKQFLDKAVRAGVVKLGGRDTGSGEFTVFLPTDFEEEPVVMLATPEPSVAPAPDVRTDSRESGREGFRDRRRRRPEREPKPTVVEETVPSSDEPEGTEPVDLGTTSAEEVPTGEVKPTTSSHLLSRGLRKGRLRFSGKAGRAELAGSEAAPQATGEAEATPEAIADDVLAPVADAESTAPATLETPEAAQETEAAKAPEEAAAASEDAAPASDQPSEVEAQVVTETPEAEAPKKRATRRGGKAVKAKAERASKSKAKTAKADTKADEKATETTAEPSAPVEEISQPVAESAPAMAVADAPAEEPAATTPNPVEVGLAASDNKPARRRSTGRRYSRKKTEGENTENAG